MSCRADTNGENRTLMRRSSSHEVNVRQEASGEWTIQCQCEDSGQRALGENAVSDVKATLTAHRSKKRFTTTKSRVRQPGGQSMFIPSAYAA